jgi:hypothetical protein
VVRYLKERCVWRHEFETLDQAREVIAAYIDHYHHQPTSGSTTAHQPKSARLGTTHNTNYKNSRANLSTPTGSAAQPPILTPGL